MHYRIVQFVVQESEWGQGGKIVLIATARNFQGKLPPAMRRVTPAQSWKVGRASGGFRDPEQPASDQEMAR